MFVVLSSTSLAFRVTCRYRIDEDHDIYSCELECLPDFDLRDVVTSVNGDHLNGKSNADVAQISANGKKLKVFPNGLSKHFNAEKIRFIFFVSAGMKEIHQSDLSGFTKLKTLNLSGNRIAIIEENLFQYNTELEFINLSWNAIKSISPHVFNHLENLSNLDVLHNICISRYAIASRLQVLDLVKEISEKCKMEPENRLSEKSTVLVAPRVDSLE